MSPDKQQVTPLRIALFLLVTAVTFALCSLIDSAVDGDRLQQVMVKHAISSHAGDLKKGLTAAGMLGEKKKIASVNLISISVSDPKHIGWIRSELAGFLVEKPKQGMHELTLKLVPGRDGIKVTTTIFPALPKSAKKHFETSVSYPDWSSLLPPLLAILIAIFFRQVLLALFSAIWLGANLHYDHNPVFSFYHAFKDYLWVHFTDTFSLQIIFFTVALIGMVHILTLAGGIQGMVDVISRWARGVRSTMVATALMGVALFFDDYANSIVVGNSARPMTDRQRISREKLAYIVDSTAAPIAGVAIISTWIGFEVDLLDGLKHNFTGVAQSGYELFFNIIPYRFYCILALVFVFANALLRRDFGPMYKAERRASTEGKVSRDGAKLLTSSDLPETMQKADIPRRWYNGLVPILGVIVFILGGILLLGKKANPAISLNPFSFAAWRDSFIAAADDIGMLLALSGVFGTLLAIVMVTSQRLLTFKEAALAWIKGVRSMWLAIAILVLAMSIRGVTDDLNTARYLVSLLSGIGMGFLPIAIFLVAAVVAFCTGTSWGTMGILLPVAIPLVAELQGAGIIMLLSASAVLDGAIFGDHCSPISDTTVLSSIASNCDHIDHVQTQAPYAITTMAIAGLCGYVFVAYGGSVVLAYGLSVLAILAVLFILGRNPDGPLKEKS